MTSTTRNLSLAGIGLAAAATVGTFLALSTNVIAPGGDVQAAVIAANCGDTITLQAGGAFPANLTLPNKGCATDIIIQSSRASELPEGQRVSPAQSPLMAHLQGTVAAEPVIKTAAGASHYKFIGVEISTVSESTVVYDLVRLGDGRQTQTTIESVPSFIVIDRSYIHGFANQFVQRGISLNCANCGVINSQISDIKGSGYDTQTVCGWNGTSQAYVLNNDLQATGENVMFGGADPASEALLPTNIEVRRNHIWKPMEWKGKGYTIKNLTEVKNCKGCTFDGNLIENNWGGEGQAGIANLATVRNQEGSAPYSIITNYVFTNNLVKNVQGALNFLGSDNEKPSQQSTGALVKNNVFDQVTDDFVTVNGFNSVTIEQNTVVGTVVGTNTITLASQPSNNFIFRDNVIDEKDYGIFGDGGTMGMAGLAKYTPGAVVVGNVVANPYSPYPDGNQAVQVLTITTDYRTPYAGKGADIDQLLAAQAGSTVSVPTPQPSPSATSTASPLASPVVPDVEVTSQANVRESPTITAAEKFIAPAGLQGVKGACQQDTASVNVYCSVTFVDNRSGFVGAQFLRSLDAPSPSPIPSPTIAPSPSPVPTASPKPSPTTTPIVFCPSGTRPGVPPKCVCRNGYKGNSGICR